MAHTEFGTLLEQTSKKLYEVVDDAHSLDEWKTQMVCLINEIVQLKSLYSSTTTIPQRCTNTTSLDPVDWSSAKSVAHQTLDATLNCIQTRRDKPVWQPIPDDIRSVINDESLPKHGLTLAKVCDDVCNYVLPYARGNTHPRFWGWAMGEGTLGGILAEMLTATININAGGCTHSAVLVERKVIHWMRQIFGFPKTEHGGIVVSGTSMATIVALASARRRLLTNVREDGIVNAPRLIVYASTEVHMCVIKALELLGMGSKAIHFISVDHDFRMNIDELKAAIDDDQKNGFLPFCIIGNAGMDVSQTVSVHFRLSIPGTVNTGAFDNLSEIASIARTQNLWFHVDGAFGSLIILDPQRRHLVHGIEQADSLAFDFHKWLHCPYDAGCVLIRDGNDLLSTFSVHQSYLANTERGCAGDKPWFCDLGSELSRSFRALKVWVTLREHGTIKLGEKIGDNCEQAQYLGSLLEKHASLVRVIRPITLNIVNFRVEPEELDRSNEALIDVFNNELLADIQISGIAVASTTRIHRRLYIRVCIISHRTVLEDFDIFVNNLLDVCRTRLHNLNSSAN
ncbi:unnamed protein product [Adineta ricciae]|uniref:Uncharacterized protein n=1 Tax=Adineta ricciae TaxID=249248 RepID=A0A815CPK6_ADIRI|nr:unnamed protein product [Adineta ricciae]